MVFSPNILKASFGLFGEPASAAHYVCFITPPSQLLFGGTLGGVLGTVLGVGGALQVSLMAESCTIPGKAMTTTPFTMYGTTVNMPYGTVYDEFSTTCMCTKSMVERTFFDTWMNFIHNPHNNRMHYLDEYTGSVVVVKINDINILDPKTVAKQPLVALGNAVSIWMLQEAFPVQIQSQELSYGSTDDYLRLTVKFGYRKYICGVDTFSKPVIGESNNIPDLSSYGPLAVQLLTNALAGVS